MSLKFAANLNFLFTEGAPNLMKKMHLAKNAGFRAVEIPYPGNDAVDAIRATQKETGLEVALINISLGASDLSFGSACISGAEGIFQKQLHETIECAKAINCKKIHLMSGLQRTDKTYEEQLKTYVKNLTYASDCLRNEDLIGVIEPINKYALPGYFMNSYETAVDVIKQINSPNLKLMVDLFHLQHICGNITNTLKDLKSLIGHIQIAQVPHRHEPDIPGELDFSYVFQLIRQNEYWDWIGCEYKPINNTTDGLGWLQKFDLQL